MGERVNREWLKSNFPCHAACPVGTEAGRYVALIAEGRYREAYAVARRPNPLASICGRICSAPCESVCRRSEVDSPVAIRALKRFITERFGVESMIDLEVLREIYGKRGVQHPDDRVAVIGAGPAGLSAAHDLALRGYPVTLFEAQPVAGGMLRLGIPEYRLPRELIKLEVNAILSLGVDLLVGQRLGRDFSISSLREQGYKAIFLAVGAQRSRDLQLPGVDLDGVMKGVEFLLNANMGYRVELGDKVVILGGGNVAIDVARMALRSNLPEDAINPSINIVTALDVARSAVRFGAKEIHVVCLESQEEMPAAPEEIEEAGREGIIFHHRRGPSRILGQNGRVTGLETVECVSVFDQHGKFNPRFAEGSELSMAADTVIMAIGQVADLSFLEPDDGIEITPMKTIGINHETLATSAPGVYAGGDAAFGPRIAIEAVADGRRAATSIHEYLRGSTEPAEAVEVILRPLPGFKRELDYEALPRQNPPKLPIARRVGIAEVEQCYTEETARREASRCFRCWINTTFREDFVTGSECILCGGCADVCPEDCIEFVPVSEVSADPLLLEDAVAEFGEAANSLFEENAVGTVLVKDETACIRCGLCAARCPASIITMEEFILEDRSYGTA